MSNQDSPVRSFGAASPAELELPDKADILRLAEDLVFDDVTLADRERAKDYLLTLGDEAYRLRALVPADWSPVFFSAIVDAINRGEAIPANVVVASKAGSITARDKAWADGVIKRALAKPSRSEATQTSLPESESNNG